MAVPTISATTASSQYDGSFPATNATNRVTNVYWVAGTSTGWLRVQYASAFAARAYYVTMSPNEPNRAPQAWTFEGSNDGTSWTVLDTRTGQSSWVSPQQTRYFTFSNATTYTYYRLNVTANNGDSLLAVDEFWVSDVVASAGSGPYPTAVLADSPRAFYRWSEASGAMAEDASGNHVAPVDFRGGYTRNAAALVADGDPAVTLATNGYGLAVVDAGLAGMSAGAITLEAVIRPSSLSDYSAIVSWDNNSVRNAIFRVDPNGALTLVWWSTGGAGPYSLSSAASTIATSTTYHVAATHDGTNVKLYVDGTQVASTTQSGGVRNDRNGALHFGAQHGPAYYFNGRLDDVAIYPTALTSTRIAAHSTAVSDAGTTTVTGAIAGTSPTGAGSLTGTAPTTGTVAGVSPVGVGSFTGTTDNTTTGTLAGTSPVGVGSLTGDVSAPAVTGTIGGTSPAGVGSLVGDTGTTSLEPWTDGAHGEALLFLDVPAGVLEVTYLATPAPPNIVEVALQRASHRMPALTGVRNMDYEIITDVVGVPHVWVDGVDVTYFRDVPTKIGSPRQESPHAWTGATLTFPKVFHYEEDGVGELAWMHRDAPVEIAIVRPDGSRIHRFTGHLTSDDPGTGQGRTESVWGVEGLLWQASHAHHPVPARLDPTDSGILVTKELNGTPSRRFAPIPRELTGDKIRNRGSRSQNRWDYVTEVLSTAVREDGKQWTIEPTGARSFRLALKDTTTVHWTVTAGAPGVELDLSKDHHERIDAVYASGVGPDGYAWSNIFFPQLLPYDPPDYPYADPDRNVLLGDRDSDTLTGHAISDWQRRIRDLGYTSLAVDGVMNSADIAAVYWIQRKRGIQVDGFMGPQTWAATWNVGTVGGDLSTVRLPMAWRTEVEPYLYGANGAVVGKNPAYDPSIIRHEVDVDFGAGVTKEQGREMAQRILERGMDPGIAGTIRLSTCPWEGSRWEVNAGDNVLLKGYRGADVLMRVAAVDPDFDSLTVTLTVDSEFRDAMAVMQVLERNRESKADPARRPGNPTRRSRLDQDQATPFEGESPAGRIPRMALFGGLWTVWPVPVSEVGIVSKLRFQTSGPASKFYLAAFGKPVTANQIAAKVPNPGAKTNPWEDAGEAWLESVAWIEGWGEQGSAAGYGLLGSEADGSPVTGELIDEAGFPYVSQVAPWIWVAMWAPVACYIEGRIYPDPVQ